MHSGTALGEPGCRAPAQAAAPLAGSGFAEGMADSTSNPSLLLSLGHAPPHKTL